jgi:hypothetical protein
MRVGNRSRIFPAVRRMRRVCTAPYKIANSEVFGQRANVESETLVPVNLRRSFNIHREAIAIAESIEPQSSPIR